MRISIRFRVLKIISLVLGMGFVFSATHAQPTPLLTDVASDSTGSLLIFYPDNWIIENNPPETLIISEQGLDSGTDQIIVRAKVEETGVIEDAETWLLERDGVPSNASLSQETYGGYESWLAQGEFQRGTYSAVVAIPLLTGNTAVIEIAFPSETLSDSAALITTLLDNLLILPDAVESERLTMHLPEGWYFSETEGVLIAAPTETDYQRLAVNLIPDGLAISVQFIRDDTSIDELLSSTTAVEIERSEFLVDGTVTILQVRRDYTDDSSEVVIIRQHATDAFVELRAVSSDPATIAEQTRLLQAIFTSIRLR